MFHFGPSGRRLLGSLHVPQRLRPRSAAILLCNPFGEEAARAHRIYRVLATQLERRGYAVLRFDYGSTGDSMGDGDEASVADWLADVELAARELTTASGARKLVAVGLRLGATLAALATSRGGLRLRHLVMWDPVVGGAGYLRELATMHRSYLQHELGAPVLASASGVPTEALGTPISRALAAELTAIDLAGEPVRTDHVTVISTRDPAAIAPLREGWGGSPSARWIELPASAAWNTDAALNASVVPMDVVQAMLERIEELSP